MEAHKNIAVLHLELDWLQAVIDQVINSYMLREGHEKRWLDIALPDLSAMDNPYANAVNKWQLDVYGRLALALTLAPHLRPELLDVFLVKNQRYDRRFTEFGGLTDNGHSGFLPTGQTLCFLITASEPGLLPVLLNIFDKQYVLMREQVIQLSETEHALPMFCGLLSLSRSWFHYFVTGQNRK